jgi:hypothetical protein
MIGTRVLYRVSCLVVLLLLRCQPTSAFIFSVNSKNVKQFIHLSAKGGKKGTGSAILKGFGSTAKKLPVETDNTPTTRAFFQFLDTNGAGDNFRRTALGNFPIAKDVKIRGVVALEALKTGDDIIDIPYELALNLGPQGEDPTIPAVQLLRDYCECYLSGQDRLAFYKMLPGFRGPDCMGSTDFFSEAALNALQSPLIVEETTLRRKLADLRFQKEIESDSNFPSWIDGSPVTLDHLIWAMWIITSRILTVQGSDGLSYRLLIPYLDMCNHDRSSKHVLTGRACNGGRLKVVAGAPIKQGAQISIVYGVAGNDRFIQDYGFLDTSTPEGFRLVAQQLLGKVRIREGRYMNVVIPDEEREQTLTRLRETTVARDEEQLLNEVDPQIRSAIEFRLGLKKALLEFIDLA